MRLPPPAHNQTSAQLLPYQKFCIRGTNLRTIRIKNKAIILAPLQTRQWGKAISLIWMGVGPHTEADDWKWNV